MKARALTRGAVFAAWVLALLPSAVVAQERSDAETPTAAGDTEPGMADEPSKLTIGSPDRPTEDTTADATVDSSSRQDSAAHTGVSDSTDEASGADARSDLGDAAEAGSSAGVASEDPAEDAALDAETAALLAQLEADSGGTIDATPGLQLYGFADVTFRKTWFPPDSAIGALVDKRSAFALGNLNLYLSSDLGSRWESLAEVRFTYLPSGSRQVNVATGEVERQDTSVSDYTNIHRTRRVGGIFIERAWLQYTADALLTLRAGSWLTPYGIWNVDHGSPTIIPVVRPYTIGLELLPEAQTGLQIRGMGYPSESLSLGYAVGLSNGRGPIQEYADLDSNKALTLRVYGTHSGAGTLTVGLSGYYGRYTDLQQSVRPTPDGVELSETVTLQYDEATVGGDLKYNYGGLHLQGEFLLNERKYTQAGRPLFSGTTFTPDIRQYGGYAIIGYRFAWLGIMPFLTGEHMVVPNILETSRPPTKDRISFFSVGVNARPTENVTLKVEGSFSVFGGQIPRDSAFADPLASVQGQAAWAF
jgi:hypothetical protein